MSVRSPRRSTWLPALLLLAPLTLAVHAQRLPSRLREPVGPPPGASAPTPAAATPAAAAAARARVRGAGPDTPVPFKAGETLVYDVSWSNYLTAGSATLTVRDKRASFGSTAYYIVAEGRPTNLVARLYAVYYKADTLLETRTLLPQRGSVFSQENGRQRLKETRFDQARRAATFQMTTSTTTTQDQSLSGPTHDALSALFALRTLALRPGSNTSFGVSDSGSLYRVTANVGGRETLQTGVGALPAWKIVPAVRDSQGQPVGRGLAVWVSDDARRLPLKIQAQMSVGTFVLTLRELR